ncbi:MAG: DUF3817 domain-containing protein [Bacteroidetes bacterium]|nr:DUF3817 domain-containing protein [Bacteroidota bacterium]MBM3423915.1 DUF3817 domain-containing protein [Bacteroidota bacterium]
MNHNTTLRFLAIAEGISYLCLGITVPLKYKLGYTLPNLIVGMTHGILFMAYCYWIVLVGQTTRRDRNFFVVGLIMSLIPFGTFWFDKKYLSTKD